MTAGDALEWIIVGLTVVSLSIFALILMFETVQVPWKFRAYFQGSFSLAMLRLSTREVYDRPAEWWGNVLWINLLIASSLLLWAVWSRSGRPRQAAPSTAESLDRTATAAERTADATERIADDVEVTHDATMLVDAPPSQERRTHYRRLEDRQVRGLE